MAFGKGSGADRGGPSGPALLRRKEMAAPESAGSQCFAVRALLDRLGGRASLCLRPLGVQHLPHQTAQAGGAHAKQEGMPEDGVVAIHWVVEILHHRLFELGVPPDARDVVDEVVIGFEISVRKDRA